jgi:hypothetical protein
VEPVHGQDEDVPGILAVVAMVSLAVAARILARVAAVVGQGRDRRGAGQQDGAEDGGSNTFGSY